MQRTRAHVGKLLSTEVVITAGNICRTMASNRGLQWTDGETDFLPQKRELLLLWLLFYSQCSSSTPAYDLRPLTPALSPAAGARMSEDAPY